MEWMENPYACMGSENDSCHISVSPFFTLG
jgi:hypothetical protein